MQSNGKPACDSVVINSTYQRMVLCWLHVKLLAAKLCLYSCFAVQLVATYHCDQAYAFDVSGTGSCATAYGSISDTTGAELGSASDASDCDTDACTPSTPSIRQVLHHFSML